VGVGVSGLSTFLEEEKGESPLVGGSPGEEELK